MLKQRVITALLLLAVLLPALFYPSIKPFAALTLLLIGAASWEWARLNGCNVNWSIGVGVGMGALMALIWLAGGLTTALRPLWLAVGAVWVLLGVAMLGRGVTGWSKWPASLRLWGGLALIACAWLALVQARVVAAYFGGKAFGRRKLAPSISPGKSWEGAISGLLGVLVLAAIWIWADGSGDSLYARLWGLGPVLAMLSLVFLSAMSVVGDLVESLVKRSAGVKDSSALLPGHGGVLDRVDALLPVLPLAMMLITI
jgi:phosphatidate cytidylyltransferase